MSLVDDLAARLKAEMGAELKTVGTTADLASLIEAKQRHALPAAYVHPVSDAAGANRLAMAVSQNMTRRVGVLLVIAAQGQTRADAAPDALSSLIDLTRQSLVGWQPSALHEPVTLARAAMVRVEDGVAAWLEEYETAEELRLPLPVPEEVAGLEFAVGVIAASADDASETLLTGAVDTEDAHVRMQPGRLSALRFPNVTIPPGRNIADAFILGSCSNSSPSAGSATIQIEDADDAAPFEATSFNISGRTLLAPVTWNMPAWSFGDRTALQLTPDLKTLVQPVVNRPGWVSGNALVFPFGFGVGTQHFLATFDHATLAPPILMVRYT